MAYFRQPTIDQVRSLIQECEPKKDVEVRCYVPERGLFCNMGLISNRKLMFVGEEYYTRGSLQFIEMSEIEEAFEQPL